MNVPHTRRLRLASGLVMFAYIFLHMTNHAIGAWSIAYAEAGLQLAMKVWQSRPGTIALYGAAITHFALALNTIYARRHWRLPAVEWLRLWAGFSLPTLLIGHVFATRVAGDWYELDTTYQNVVGMLVRGGLQGWQISLLAPGWVHGCLGLWLSLRRYPLMQRLRPALLAFMIGMPVLSAVGFTAMAGAVVGKPPADGYQTTSEQKAALDLWRRVSIGLYLLLLGGAAGAGFVRNAGAPHDHHAREGAQTHAPDPGA